MAAPSPSWSRPPAVAAVSAAATASPAAALAAHVDFLFADSNLQKDDWLWRLIVARAALPPVPPFAVPLAHLLSCRRIAAITRSASELAEAVRVHAAATLAVSADGRWVWRRDHEARGPTRPPPHAFDDRTIYFEGWRGAGGEAAGPSVVTVAAACAVFGAVAHVALPAFPALRDGTASRWKGYGFVEMAAVAAARALVAAWGCEAASGTPAAAAASSTSDALVAATVSSASAASPALAVLDDDGGADSGRSELAPPVMRRRLISVDDRDAVRWAECANSLSDERGEPPPTPFDVVMEKARWLALKQHAKDWAAGVAAVSSPLGDDGTAARGGAASAAESAVAPASAASAAPRDGAAAWSGCCVRIEALPCRPGETTFAQLRHLMSIVAPPAFVDCPTLHQRPPGTGDGVRRRGGSRAGERRSTTLQSLRREASAAAAGVRGSAWSADYHVHPAIAAAASGNASTGLMTSAVVRYRTAANAQATVDHFTRHPIALHGLPLQLWRLTGDEETAYLATVVAGRAAYQDAKAAAMRRDHGRSVAADESSRLEVRSGAVTEGLPVAGAKRRRAPDDGDGADAGALASAAAAAVAVDRPSGAVAPVSAGALPPAKRARRDDDTPRSAAGGSGGGVGGSGSGSHADAADLLTDALATVAGRGSCEMG